MLWSQIFKYFPRSTRQFVGQTAGEQYNNECLKATLKHSQGSFQVWGIFANEVGVLIMVYSILNAEKYRQFMSDIQTQKMSLRTIFSVKNNKNFVQLYLEELTLF